MQPETSVTIFESPFAPREAPIRAVSGPAQLAHDGSYAVQSVLRVLSRRRRWIAGSIVLCLVVAVVATLFMKPVYEATATIELNKESAGSLDMGLRDTGHAQNASGEDLGTDLETETAILESDSLALSVIRQLNLSAQATSSKGSPAAEARAEDSPEARAGLLDVFRRRLKVKPVRGTRLIQVTYEGHDPQQAAQVANTLIESYKRQYLQSHYDATSEASEWLTRQLSELKTNVESSEKKLTDFEKDSGILNLPSVAMAADSPGGGEVHSVVLEKLDTLNTELTEAEANAIEKESIYRLALTGNYGAITEFGANRRPAGAGIASAAQGTSATELEQLQGKQNDLKVELAQQAQIYGANNRHLKELQLQESVVDGQIREEMQRIVERAAGDFQIAKRTEQGLRQRFDRQEMEASKLNEKAVQFAVLSQEAGSRKKLYEDLYTRLQEANVSAGIKATNITIVDPARAQFNPTRPRRLFNLEVGLLMGLFSGLTLAFVADGIDRTVVNPLEVEEITGLRVLGVIPTFGAKRGGYGVRAAEGLIQARAQAGRPDAVVMEPIWMLNHPESVAAEAFRTVRTAVLLSRAGAAPKVILVTSCIPGEGKSTLTANLAVSFAQHGKKVLIVEADMRRPSMGHVMRIPNQVGLSTVLAGASKLEETILHGIHVPTLDVLPSGPRPPMPSEILGSGPFDRLLETLRALYDIILIDSPPALLLTDAVSISRKTDATIWVARSGVVTRPYLARAAQLIERSRMPAIGFVLNRMDKDADPYGYGYGFGGGYAYGHEYEEPKGAAEYPHDA